MKLLITAAATSALALAVNVALAQEKPPQAEGPAAGPNSEIQEVIVTGTRRKDRTVAESSAPIDVLSGADLALQPNANMLDTLSNMVPSFIVGQNSISDASSFVRSPSLRGLPGDEMLVMLNGKRMNRSALVQVYQGGETELSFGSQGPDLASIPSIAVKNLEILRDGASAQYGSDAIAGVLNYQFRDNSEGFEVMARDGKYFPGNGFKSDGNDGIVAANLGLPLGGQGFLNISAEWSKNQQTNRGVTRASALAFAENFPALAPDLPHYPGPVQEWGTPPSDSFKAFVNSGIHLTNGDELYFFWNYANIQTNESFNYRLSQTVTGNDGITYGHHPAFSDIYLDPCTAHPTFTNCPAGSWIQDSTTFNFSSIYPAGFTPRFYGTTQESFAAIGYKGTTSYGMTYDFSGTRATNSLAVGLKSSLNPSLGPDSPTSFYDGKFVQNETNFNLDVTYPWAVPGFASPISVAAGAEWRDENYQQLLGDAASYAAGPYASQPLVTCNFTTSACTPVAGPGASQSTASNGYGGISASVDASQVSYAAYVDLEADVVKDLTLGIAGRYEDYASFGSTTLGKFQIRWKATDWLSLRGTVSNGFHAPTPGQSNVETLSTTFIPGTATQVQIGTYPVTSSVAKYYGATALKPEKSVNESFGVVLTPMEGMLLTIDTYKIKVTDRIGISQAFTVTQADINALHDLAYVGAGGTVQYFTNGFDTTTKGLDVVLTNQWHVGAGSLGTTLAYNYNKTDVDSYNPAVITQARIIDIQHYAPNNRVNLTGDYRMGPFTATLHENYYGTYRDENDYPGQLFSAKFTTDLDFGYEIWKNVTAGIGARNLFNAFPDKILNTYDPVTNPNGIRIYGATGGQIDGEVYPRTGGPFGFNGRFVYARIGAKF